MAEKTAPASRPIERIENYDLLQTDLIAFIIAEAGIDIFERASTSAPAFTALDIALSPMACMAQSFSKSLNANILEGGAIGMYPAVVLIPFKDGAGGRQACKAIVPQIHPCADNPFATTDEFVRAEMMSHFPIFTFNDGLSEASSPLVPGSIILISFDNPENWWTTGAIEKVIKGRPDVLPEWALTIESIKALWDGPAAKTAVLVSGGSGIEMRDYADAPKTAWEQLQALGSAGVSKATSNNVCTSINALKGGERGKNNEYPLFPVDGTLGMLGVDAGRGHARSIDISCPTGTPVYAALDGDIVSVQPHNGRCGGTVVVRYKFKNGDVRQTYCHFSQIPDVAVGYEFKRGDVIGITGGGKGEPGAGNTSGPHLHITTGFTQKQFLKKFGWDFSGTSKGKLIVGKSSCDGS
tara:strand:- start:1837 stop:3066 length:1230 start_codon:yes stop_codon:yes gene_type:complete